MADLSRSSEVTDEYLPGVSMSKTQASRAQGEAQEVAAMMALPAWQWAARWLSDMARAQRATLLGAELDEIEATQRAADSYDAPLHIADEVLFRSVAAAASLAVPAEANVFGWSAELHGLPAGGLVEYGKDVAQQNIANAAFAGELVGHVGWKILMRELAARARANAGMLRHASRLEAERLRANIAATRQLLFEIKSILDLGVDSEAYLRVCAERQKKEGD